MLYKSRTLSADCGDLSSPKRYPSTGIVYYDNATYKDVMDKYEYYYSKARALASTLVALPTGMGEETLESTTKKKPLFNNCYHKKKYGFNYPYLAVVVLPPASGYVQHYWRRACPTSANSISKLPPFVAIPWSELEGAQRRAWWSMQPRFETEVQLLNFIYELKDFKSLVKSVGSFNWHSFTVKVQKLRRLAGKSRSGLNNKSTLADAWNSLSSVTNTLSSSWLQWAFAWGPLIRDLSEIHKLLKYTIAQTQQEFADRGLESQISHYSEVLRNINPGTRTGACLEIYTGGRQFALFTSTLEYTYDYVMREGSELYKKALGLELTAEVLWNGTPFTFLFDYFCSIGKAIHNMALDENVGLHVSQYCESLLVQNHIGEAFDTKHIAVHNLYSPSINGGRGIGISETYTPINGCIESQFQRRVCSPNRGAALPQFKLPSSRQVVNMLALVRSMIGHQSTPVS